MNSNYCYATFEFQILSDVTLMCRIHGYGQGVYYTSHEYQWNTGYCYNNLNFNGGNPMCFPTGQTTQDVTGYSLTAQDSGTITCNITYHNVTYISSQFRVRVTG